MPMMSLLVPFFDGLISTWQRMRRNPAYSYLADMLDAGIDKLVEQLAQYRFSKAAILCILLNPPLGWQWLEANWPSHRVEAAKEIIIKTLKEYDIAVHNNLPAATPALKEDDAHRAAYLLFSTDISSAQQTSNSLPSVQTEFSTYCHLSNRPPLGVDLIEWWQDHQKAYPRLFRMSMDYLPAQASSVPAERVFSSSAETDTRRRNHLSPYLMEQLQMLKFMLKKARLDFTAVWRFEVEDAELENEWIDRSVSIGSDDAEKAFYSLLDLLEQEADEETAETPDKEYQYAAGNYRDYEDDEVIHFDDDSAEYSDEWVEEP
ncbi:hypothetical protein M422DRAFT_784217 [Sphaerobolus stellatus SS14]|uniref:Unplaced genomic scaffold SPHSTscaffold_201, whole genome shotgun sequence n=1 Tax=Sphaerobolus stellatus (strain SS14) TaxID=990650 RepID=A0A0C9U653_SPHS4|nr:hypothetical protein M422DRAFT_784217 [Sphaerobolus stellatus SS14]